MLGKQQIFNSTTNNTTLKIGIDENSALFKNKVLLTIKVLPALKNTQTILF